jgi:phage baseplate assembly protein gpV
VDDPDGKGRVRVKLPTYAEVETEWMQVLTVGAGEGKGLTILPDVDDRVLVLIMPGAMSQGIVLGGLYGMDGPPDSGVEDRSVRRFTLLTPGGQRVRLDDSNGVVYIENSEGSFIELAPDHVKLHAAADFTLEAPGKKVVIRGHKIDFQRA